MKLGFISDTHGSLKWTKKALDFLEDCDHILHLGDVLYHGPRNPLPEEYDPKGVAALLHDREDISYIRGNCDSDVDQMITGQDLKNKNRVFQFDGLRFYCVHGYEETLEDRLERAKAFGAQVIVTGHTHIKVLEKVDGIVVLNPGSTTRPKDGSHSLASYEDGCFRLYDLETGEVLSSLELD